MEGYEEKVWHIGPTGEEYHWVFQNFNPFRRCHRREGRWIPRRQSVSSSEGGGWGRTGFPGKSCWFELNDETPAHLKNKEVHIEVGNQIHNQWHEAKVTVDYTVPNKEKVQYAKKLEAALLKYTSRSLDQGNIRGVGEVLKHLAHTDSKYRDAGHTAEAKKKWQRLLSLAWIPVSTT